MPHPYFRYGALVMSVFPGIFGFNALFNPEKMMASAQFPVPKEPEGRKMALSLMRFFGTRNIGISYLLLLNWMRGDEKQIGLGLFTGLWMSFMDGLISRWQIGGGEWNHWSFIPVLLGIAGGLLGLFG